MRIAQVATLSAPVHPDTHGSVESLIWLLTRELARQGHEVTVFGTAGSECAGRVVATLPAPYGQGGSPDDWQLCEWINLCRAVEQSERFDIIHSHSYLWGLPLQPFSRTRIAHTLHIVPDDNHARLWAMWPDACVTALSRHQWSAYPHLHPAAVVPHGVDVAQFTFRRAPEDYLLFLGRFVPGKGPLHAIHAARSLGRRLVLAGPENPYFREKVQPLVDGKTVQYAGFVRGTERDRLLGGAQALLYPIQYPEAFGLVLVEAMLCGVPVAASRLGAVPEIVEDGIGGCLAETMDSFPRTVVKTLSLDRQKVREHAIARFSAEKMAQAYGRVYETLATR